MAVLMSLHKPVGVKVAYMRILPMEEQDRIIVYLDSMKIKIEDDKYVPSYLKEEAYQSVKEIVTKIALERFFADPYAPNPVISYGAFYRK